MTPGKIALVHDWLTGMRGGERALEVLCERYPHAELFTLVHIPGSVSPTIERHKIHTSFIQQLPAVARYYRHYLPLFPAAIERFRFDSFDTVISISHCRVKSVITPKTTHHLLLLPDFDALVSINLDAYFGPERVGWLGSQMMRPVMARLAKWDRETADRAERYVAISHYVAGRIGRYYNREASVVYPTVDTDFYHPGAGAPESFALIVSALVPYKRIDVAIDACTRQRAEDCWRRT